LQPPTILDTPPTRRPAGCSCRRTASRGRAWSGRTARCRSPAMHIPVLSTRNDESGESHDLIRQECMTSVIICQYIIVRRVQVHDSKQNGRGQHATKLVTSDAHLHPQHSGGRLCAHNEWGVGSDERRAASVAHARKICAEQLPLDLFAQLDRVGRLHRHLQHAVRCGSEGHHRVVRVPCVYSTTEPNRRLRLPCALRAHKNVQHKTDLLRKGLRALSRRSQSSMVL
jgi:hypothetical protein